MSLVESDSTVSLFISGLAFNDPVLSDLFKIGIFAASIVAGITGYVLLRGLGRPSAAVDAPQKNSAQQNYRHEPQVDGQWRCIYVEAGIFGSQLNTPAPPTTMLSRVRS